MLETIIGSTAVVALLLCTAGWLARTWIKERLAASIKIETETQLATARDQLHRETETALARLRIRLETAENRLADARRAGIDANQQLYVGVIPERIAGVKALWAGIADANNASVVTMLISFLDWNMVQAEIRRQGERTYADHIKQMLDELKYRELMNRLNAVRQWRPFVTERAWAWFAAYNTFYTTRLLRAFALAWRQEELAERLWRVNSELSLVQAVATPEIATRFAGDPYSGASAFLEYVEGELLAELRSSLSGEESGPEAATRAAAIMLAVERASTENAEAQVPGQPK